MGATGGCAGRRERAAGFGAASVFITDAIPGIERGLPTLRDPDRLTYYKEDVGGLVMGGYEPNPRPWALDGFPTISISSCWHRTGDHFQPILDLAMPRVPALATAGVKELHQRAGEFYA
jgi:4-methylaminobutanoate oxidase (formaldehyde-forming)